MRLSLKITLGLTGACVSVTFLLMHAGKIGDLCGDEHPCYLMLDKMTIVVYSLSIKKETDKVIHPYF